MTRSSRPTAAWSELAATGETARKRTVETSRELTAQETQIARLARDGLSNPPTPAGAGPGPDWPLGLCSGGYDRHRPA